MSANPTRFEWHAATAPASPLEAGNRAVESIARQDAMGALLAFSDLHEQIQNRRMATGRAADRDLFETERFVRDEVLQLICDRVQAITKADGVVIALAERANAVPPELVCRAATGKISLERGVRLLGESAFLRDCLEAGQILRCDDCDIDERVAMDTARQVSARSTVIVPLCGRHEQLGVLQVFSANPWAFSDHDIRCFDLFAELVLSGLRPEDQDRRIHWLSDVADGVLRTKAIATAIPVVEASAVIAEKTAAVIKAETTSESKAAETPIIGESIPVPVEAIATPVTATSEITELSELITIPVETVELPGQPSDQTEELSVEEPEHATVEIVEPEIDDVSPSEPGFRLLRFPQRAPAIPGSRRPGLSAVAGLIAVAALFAAGAWWGIEVHGKTAVTKVTATRITAPQSVTAPAPPTNVLTPGAPDPLLTSENPNGEEAPFTAVPDSKLAALPKITGVRHWSSSTGSTVVIDMEDEVPYEVHRLMSPERIYFDLHDTVLAHELDSKTMDVGDASLTRVRVAQPVAGLTRVVLDTKDGSNFSVSMESNPYRLVVELRGNTKSLASSPTATSRTAALNASTGLAKTQTAPASMAKANESSLPAVPAKTGKFRIVLDAGHGGWDLGTVGREGLLEKDLVLDVAQRLGKLLQAHLGADVIFTRNGDTYLPLDQRADLANQAQADLFVSVHANYSSSVSARGIETYYTNTFVAPGSKEVEKHDENSAKLMPVTLSPGGLHEKIEESRKLASSVQRSLYGSLASSSPDIRDRGIKDASFAVLTGTTMPAILTEISFVSSPADEHKLQSATYRQQVAEALYKGIARYEEATPRTKMAQLRTTAASR